MKKSQIAGILFGVAMGVLFSVSLGTVGFVLGASFASLGMVMFKGLDDGAVNVIAVENGAVYMKEANCRDGLCIHQGKMKNAAKTIVCLPHKLVVRLEGDSAPDGQDDLDVIIQ